MTVVIRMKRTGRRNRPCYRISVADRRSPRDGSTLESLGLYDPIAAKEDAQLTLNVERAKYWVSQGAQPSETVRSIFQKNGVYEGKVEKAKRDRSARKKKTKKRERRVAAKKVRAERRPAKAKKPAAEPAVAAEAKSEG
jgi:small subunit ribosomal protein S16